MTQREESQQLLAVVDQDEESGDEQPTLFQTPPEQLPLSPPEQLPPPTAPSQTVTFLPTSEYNDSVPATLSNTSATVYDGACLPPPPDYSLHGVPVLPPKYTPLPGSGVSFPVNVHMDGRLVPATLTQDPSGNHMVYICEPPNDQNANTASARPKPPKDYLSLSLVGLFCSFLFLPLALMALIKSFEVHRRFKLGDYAGAEMASKKAQKWGSASIVFGIFSLLLIITMRYFLQGAHYRKYYY